MCVLSSLGCVSTVGIVGHMEKSMCNLLENGQAIFFSNFFITHNSQGFCTVKLLWEPLSNNL